MTTAPDLLQIFLAPKVSCKTPKRGTPRRLSSGFRVLRATASSLRKDHPGLLTAMTTAPDLLQIFLGLTRSEPLIDCSFAAAKNSSVAGCAGSIHEEGRFAYAMTLVRVPPKIQCQELPISVPILMACCLLQSLSAHVEVNSSNLS